MEHETQKAKIAARLLSGKTITPMEALKDYGCFRLAVHINRLRNEGMKIHTENVRNGKKQFARYSLIKEQIQAK